MTSQRTNNTFVSEGFFLTEANLILWNFGQKKKKNPNHVNESSDINMSEIKTNVLKIIRHQSHKNKKINKNGHQFLLRWSLTILSDKRTIQSDTTTENSSASPYSKILAFVTWTMT